MKKFFNKMQNKANALVIRAKELLNNSPPNLPNIQSCIK